MALHIGSWWRSLAMAMAAAASAQMPTWTLEPQMAGAHAAAFDPQHGRVLALEARPSAINEWNTWESIGDNWYYRRCSILSSLTYARLVYHPRRQRFLLFGMPMLQGGSFYEWNGDWQQLPTPPLAYANVMAYDEVRDRLVVVPLSGQTWEWNGSTWTASGPAPAGLVSMTFVPALGRVLACSQATSNGPIDIWSWTGSSWIAHPATPPAIQTQYPPVLGYDAIRGAALLVEGLIGPSQPHNIWLWTGTAWIPDGSAAFRGFPVCVYTDTLTNEVRMVASSMASPLTLDLLARRNGSWVSLPLPASPGLRTSAAMATDAAGDVLLYGGNILGQPTSAADTWRWQGGWARLPTTQDPGPRASHHMCFVPALQRVALFGGSASTDVFEWTGSDWTLSAASPAPVASGFLTVDPATGGLAVVTAATTWRWHNGAWAGTPTNGPPVLSSPTWAKFAHDPANRRVLCFDGPTAQTWQWDGQVWQQILTPVSPPARLAHGMTFDGDLGCLVVNGGRTGSTALLDSWLFDGSNWTQVPAPMQQSEHPALGWSRALHCTIHHGCSLYASQAPVWYLSLASPPAVTSLGSPCFGNLLLQAPLLPRLGYAAFTLLGRNAGVGTPVILLLSSQQPLNLGYGCTLFPALPGVTAFGLADNLGVAAFPCPITNGAQLRGLEFCSQAIMPVASSPLSLGTSNGLVLRIGD